MSYAWDITIPAGTSESSPVEQILKVHKGVITKIEIKFPAGCHGMVKVRLFRWEAQLVPLNRDGWITGDDEPVTYNLYYELEDEPYQLKFIGASPGTSYDHTITVRIEILPKSVAMIAPALNRLVNLFKRIFGVRSVG